MDPREQIRQKVAEVIAKARQLFPDYAHAPNPEITFFDKGRAAGWAYGCVKLRFNLSVAMQNMDNMLNDTVAHEVAHLVCSFTNRGRRHDAGWKRVCLALGGSAAVRYNADELGVTVQKARRTRQYRYVATCGTELWIPSNTHTKMVRKNQTRVLRSTGGKVTPAQFTGQVRMV